MTKRKSKADKGATKTAIVVAFRKEEDDLQATVEAAANSAGAGATIYQVEDKDRSGPGANRHRGIEAAEDAEVILIIDAHMRFQGDVLARMVAHVKKHSGLVTALCHHNEECSFTGKGGHFYAGARIVYRVRDDQGQKVLDAKWARDNTPGERACVMGACYAFRRDWYYDAGQPLSILTGWGCDEQVLSIAAWLTGHMPLVLDGHVAHRWRSSPPWAVTREERMAVIASRAAMVHCLVSNASDRQDLIAWGNLPDVPFSPAVERFKNAMVNARRKWRAWRAQVCEPDEIDGRQEPVATIPTSTPRRFHSQTPLVARTGTKCPHCGNIHEHPPVTHTYPNGNKRHQCPTCANFFMSYLRATA